MADKAIADAVAKALAENAPPEIGPVPAPVATTTTPVVVDLDFFGAEASGMSTDAKGLAVNKLRSTRHIDEIFEQQRANTVPTMHPKYRALMWKRGEINGENIAGTPVNLNVVAMEGRTEVSPEVLKQLRLKSGITDLEVRLLTADEFITNGLAKSHKFVNTEGHKWVVLYSPSRNFTTSS